METGKDVSPDRVCDEGKVAVVSTKGESGRLDYHVAVVEISVLSKRVSVCLCVCGCVKPVALSLGQPTVSVRVNQQRKIQQGGRKKQRNIERGL
jgi:hypothetical protein